MAEAPLASKLSLRERERLLDGKAGVLDLETDIGFRQTLRILVRALGYARYFKARIAAKFVLNALGTIIPLMLMPWPIKLVVDHVILGQPIAEGGAGFPVYFAPFAQFLSGKGPVEMMLWLVLVSAGLVILCGAFGGGKAGNDIAIADMAQGHDTATRSSGADRAEMPGWRGILAGMFTDGGTLNLGA